MADLSENLGAASGELKAMGAELDGAERATAPHLAGDLVSAMDGAWAAQLELTLQLGDELRDLAAAVRVAAHRYIDADQAF